MASTLPDNPSSEHLRKEARTLQRASTERLPLHVAQLRVARQYGFSGWPALVRYLDLVADLAVDPSSVSEARLADADRFCALAVLQYTDRDAPPRWESAAQSLQDEPDLADTHIWAAAAAGDPEALARNLDRGVAADATGGPYGWPPLLYLCYTRAAIERRSRSESTTDQMCATATLLLDVGADPNAGNLWRGMATPFTALTGVLGEGELGPRRQPRHPAANKLAELLLRRGAHPVDHQALYNRMFRPDDSHLELLFAHGLADAGPSPWERKLAEAMESRAQMWRRQVDWAAEHGFVRRLDLLARNGVDTSGVTPVLPRIPDDVNAFDEQGATPLHHAAWGGDLELIRRLLDRGADPSLVDMRFKATAQGWAEHAYQTEAADLLRSVIG